MSVPIKQEEGPSHLYERERCFSCRTPTIFWTDLPDRSPGQQVACCPGCACDVKPAEVPTKEQWFANEGARRYR